MSLITYTEEYKTEVTRKIEKVFASLGDKDLSNYVDCAWLGEGEDRICIYNLNGEVLEDSLQDKFWNIVLHFSYDKDADYVDKLIQEEFGIGTVADFIMAYPIQRKEYISKVIVSCYDSVDGNLYLKGKGDMEVEEWSFGKMMARDFEKARKFELKMAGVSSEEELRRKIKERIKQGITPLTKQKSDKTFV